MPDKALQPLLPFYIQEGPITSGRSKCVCVYGHDVYISIKKTAIVLAVASFSTVTVFNFLKIESTCTLS